jgi:hypothetical protein
VVVVFIGFVLLQRENRASDETEYDRQTAAETGGLRRRRKKPLERSYDLEAKSRKAKQHADSSPVACQISLLRRQSHAVSSLLLLTWAAGTLRSHHFKKRYRTSGRLSTVKVKKFGGEQKNEFFGFITQFTSRFCRDGPSATAPAPASVLGIRWKNEQPVVESQFLGL